MLTLLPLIKELLKCRLIPVRVKTLTLNHLNFSSSPVHVLPLSGIGCHSRASFFTLHLSWNHSKAKWCLVTVRIYSDKWQRCLLDKPGLGVNTSTLQKSQIELGSSSMSETVRKPLISSNLREESVCLLVSGYSPFPRNT